MHRAPLLAWLALSLSALPQLLGCTEESLPALPDPPPIYLTEAEGRPARIYAPSDYDPGTRYPLVVLLHGYGASGGVQNLYLGLSNQVTTEQYLLVVPDGTVDDLGNRFWNASPSCCHIDGPDVDDVAYLRRLIAEAQANYRVDPRRVYLLGHSNGGFMSYRMACDASDIITAIVSLNGMPPESPDDCAIEEPVSVLHIHGTADEDVLYDGRATTDGTGYPSAPASVARYAGYAGCDLDAAEPGEPLNLDRELPGNESDVLRYRAGCRGGVDAELWTINEGGHLPNRTPEFTTGALQWLTRHRR